MHGPAIIVHSLDHARAALAAAAALGRPLTLLSAPGASFYAGAGYFARLAEIATAEFPTVRMRAVLDCADAPGHVLGALRCGLKAVRFTGPPEVAAKLHDIAAQHGAELITDPLPALDLCDALDAATACRAWLAGGAPHPLATRATSPPGRADQTWWHPESFATRRKLLEKRAAIADAVRAYFRQRDFLEVETPALQISPGLEPHLVAFATEIRDPGARSGRLLYLHTSPEFAMKKLLVGGLPRIFQLARVFRNAERSATHHPEFTMLEWYRAQADTAALMTDCENLLRAALAAAGADRFTWQGRACDLSSAAERLGVQAAFQRHAGIDLLATAPDPHAPSLALLAGAAERIGIAAHAGDTWEDLFFRIFLDRVEPQLGVGRPTILTDYPISMAALARAKPGDPRLADRFELYVCGLELANAFGELTDAAEQRRRFERDVAAKRARYGEAYPIDEDFLAALAHGMPEAAGIALGFDRLVMLATGASAIEDVLWAPVAAPDGEER